MSEENGQTKEGQRPNNLVFCLGHGNPDLPPTLLLGITEAAWDYLKQGGVNHFDLSSMGLELRVVVFGGKDQEEVYEALRIAAKSAGGELLDQRDKDHGVKGLEAF